MRARTWRKGRFEKARGAYCSFLSPSHYQTIHVLDSDARKEEHQHVVSTSLGVQLLDWSSQSSFLSPGVGLNHPLVLVAPLRQLVFMARGRSI